MIDNEQRSTQPTPMTTRRRILRIMMLAVGCYGVICLMLAFFQRKLIYAPTRRAVSVAESGFAPDRIEEVTLEVAEKVQIHGWYCQCLPDGGSSRSSLVIIFPGNAGNRLNRVGLMSDLHELGCHTLIFDYRGYGGSGGSPAEELIALDSQMIWDFATQELGFRSDQIYIFGQSLGGGVATRLAWEKSKQQTPPRGLILQATFTSLVDAAKFNYPWLPVSRLLVDRYPSIDRMPSVTCPVLVIHGRQDRIVPFELGQRLFDAAPEKSVTGVAKRFVELPHAGHNDIAYVAAEEVNDATRQFLDEVDQAAVNADRYSSSMD